MIFSELFQNLTSCDYQTRDALVFRIYIFLTFYMSGLIGEYTRDYVAAYWRIFAALKIYDGTSSCLPPISMLSEPHGGSKQCNILGAGQMAK